MTVTKSGKNATAMQQSHSGFPAGAGFQTPIISKPSTTALPHCTFSMWLPWFHSFNIGTIYLKHPIIMVVMELFTEVELIKELKALETSSREEMSETALEQNRAELGNYFTNLQEVSPSSFARLQHSKGNLQRNKI